MSTAQAAAARLLIPASILVSLWSVTPALAEASPETLAEIRTAIAKMTPYDVGSRYGQALGAAEICTGAKATEKAQALDKVYTDADHATFKTQATKIYNAWTKIKHCTVEGDPNQCKVVVDESCEAAIADVGPSGKVLPGLLEELP